MFRKCLPLQGWLLDYYVPNLGKSHRQSPGFASRDLQNPQSSLLNLFSVTWVVSSLVAWGKREAALTNAGLAAVCPLSCLMGRGWWGPPTRGLCLYTKQQWNLNTQIYTWNIVINTSKVSLVLSMQAQSWTFGGLGVEKVVFVNCNCNMWGNMLLQYDSLLIMVRFHCCLVYRNNPPGSLITSFPGHQFNTGVHVQAVRVICMRAW